MFCFLASRHVESQLPNQGSNLHLLNWKVKSQPLDCQGNPSLVHSLHGEQCHNRICVLERCSAVCNERMEPERCIRGWFSSSHEKDWGLDVKVCLRKNTLATWWEELTHWKRPWFWERLKAGEGDNKEWDGWIASLTRWTWVWASSRSWWWTGKPGVLQSMGSQRVGHDWATELNWTEEER